MSNNHLTSLPESFSELKQLTDLFANENQLTTLPKTFGKLGALQRLHLCNNLIDSFPSAIRKLKNLEELSVGGNPFVVVDSARLTLELPKLRVFSAPVMLPK